MFDRIGKDTAIALFYGFVVLVLAWTSTQTIHAVRNVLPNDPIAPYVALGLFDAGALAWLFSFLKHAQGTQRTIAFWMTFVDLAGVVAMVAGALEILSARGVTVSILLATLLNVFAVYVYHLFSPANREQIAIQNFKDKVFDESLKQAEKNVQSNIRAHGAIMALGLLAQFKYDLGLPLSESERAALQDDVIDAQAVNIPELEQPAPRVWPAWLIAAAKFFGKYKPVNVTNPTEPAPESAGGSTDTQAPAQPSQPRLPGKRSKPRRG
ncbi:MAG: hypothetical protein AB1649_03420 [Chloroflexota bacterium]